MNRKLMHNFGCLIVIAMLSFSIVVTVTNVNAYQSQPSNSSVTVAETLSNMKQSQIVLNDTVWFDITKFTNQSQILVNRTLELRVYGFTRDNTTIMIYNNDSYTFNTFNISVPVSESTSLHYYEFKDLGNPDYTPNITQISYEENFTTFTLHIADVEPDSWRNISMIAGYADRIYPYYAESDLCYNFSISFCPLTSMPITSYSLELWFFDTGVASQSAQLFVTDSLSPNVTFSFENFTDPSGVEYAGLLFKNITELPSVNLTLMDQFGYQNLGENFTFIPGFQPDLAQNLSIPLTFNVTLESPLMECEKLIRRLEIDQWGVLRIYETMTLVNLGHSGHSRGLSTYDYDQGRFLISAPDGLIFRGATDFYGNLTVDTQDVVSPYSDFNWTNVLIKTRLYVLSNESYTFTLAYDLPLPSVVNTTASGTLDFRSWLCSRFNWTVRDFELEVVLPAGATTNFDRISGFRGTYSSINLTSEPSFLGLASLTKISLQYYNLTEYHNTFFHIEYDPGFLWALWTPMTISLVFFLLGLVYLVTRSLTFSVRGLSGTIGEEIPVENIKDFIQTYEEKTALQKRIDTLDTRYAGGKTKKRKYEDDRAILVAELTKIQRQTVTFSNTLKRKGYDNFMRVIENSETEKEDLKANLSRLRQRYSKGTISKEQFERQQRQYEKKLQDTTTRIDRTLIDLRSKLEQAKSK